MTKLQFGGLVTLVKKVEIFQINTTKVIKFLEETFKGQITFVQMNYTETEFDIKVILTFVTPPSNKKDYEQEKMYFRGVIKGLTFMK